MKRLIVFVGVIVILAMLATSCVAPTPQVVEKEKIVEKVVTQVVEKQVQVVQTQVVEKTSRSRSRFRSPLLRNRRGPSGHQRLPDHR